MASYAALAELMSKHPEVLILRSFSKLHIRNLLYYQAELAELEAELEEAEQDDLACEQRKQLCQHWKSLTATGTSSKMVGDQAANEDPRLREQWNLMLRTRQVLREYDEALVQYAGVQTATRPPGHTSTRRLREWLETPEFGNSFISGKVEGVWDSEKGSNDFAVPNLGSGTTDRLTFGLMALMTYLESQLKRKTQPRAELHEVSSSTETTVKRAVAATIASMLPVLPIIVLSYVDRLVLRLWMVLLFTALLAFVLVFGLMLDTDKVLVLTTAFAAVQVVFVGSTNSGHGCSGKAG